MREKNELIFWSKSREESFDEAAERTYALLQMLREHGEEVYPRYQGKRRKNKVPFEWNLENFKKAFRKSGDKDFQDIGYTMWFLSTPEEKTQACILFSNGTRSPRLQNTLNIRLSPDFSFYEEENIHNVEQIFRKCIDRFDPYWGAVINTNNTRRPEYKESSLDERVHWLNYWGPEQVEEVGEEKLQQAPLLAVEKHYEGYLLKLQPSLIRSDGEEDFQRQLNVHRYLGW